MIQGPRPQRSFDSSAGLIAVFHALRRLLAPRHPPHALSSLAALTSSSRPDPREGRKGEGGRPTVTLPARLASTGPRVTILFSQGSCRDRKKLAAASPGPTRPDDATPSS